MCKNGYRGEACEETERTGNVLDQNITLILHTCLLSTGGMSEEAISNGVSANTLF